MLVGSLLGVLQIFPSFYKTKAKRIASVFSFA